MPVLMGCVHREIKVKAQYHFVSSHFISSVRTYKHVQDVREVLLGISAQHDGLSLRVLAFESGRGEQREQERRGKRGEIRERGHGGEGREKAREKGGKKSEKRSERKGEIRFLVFETIEE